MPALDNKIYFNYGGQGPLPKPSLEAIVNSWTKIQELGPFTNNVWPYLMNEVNETKEVLAKLCGVSRNRMVLTENVTSGCVLPLLGLPFKKEERLLISDCEHPGIVAACKELARRKQLFIDILPVKQLRRGVEEIKETQKDLIKLLEEKLTSQTKLLALSHVLWNTGQIMPISLIADRLSTHPNAPFLLVDAAQSLGQISIKDAASKADIYAFTGHKWAYGPEGLGGVVVSERVLEQSHPTMVGWKSLKNEESIYTENKKPFHDDGRRFEVATSCIPLLAGLRCSLKLLEEECSESDRTKMIQGLSKNLWNKLKEMDNIETILQGSPPAGLVSFRPTKDSNPRDIVHKLGKKKIWIRVLEDPSWLRACLHITSNKNEIKELAIALRDIIKLK